MTLQQHDDFDALLHAPPNPETGNAAPLVTDRGGAQSEACGPQATVYPETGEKSTADDFDALLWECLPVDKPIAVTRFLTMGAGRKVERHISLRQLGDEIAAASAGSKHGLPWFKLATFGDLSTDKGSLRNNANVLSVTGIEADYDAGEMSLAEAEGRLRAANVAALLYTTPSHTDDKPRWRVFAPFGEARDPGERTRFMERLNGVLGGTLDGASFTLSQSYYGGNVAGRPPIIVRLVEGRAIDNAADLDATALPKGKKHCDGETVDSVDKSGSGELFALASRLKRGGGTIDDLRSALLEPDNALAAAHVEKEETVGKGRGERAVTRVWERAPDPVDLAAEFDDFDDETTASRLRFLSPGECADAPARGYVIKGLLAPGDVGCIYGAPGAGKSLISPHLGYAVAQGRSAFGMRTKTGRVFYVAAEDPHGMRGRVSALKLRHGDGDNFTLVEGVSDLLTKGSPDLAALMAAIEDQRPSLIFVDTLAMAFPGLEENSAEAMGNVVAIARRLASHGAAVVLIHHDTKAGTPTPRGHSLLNGALDVALQLHARDEHGIVRGRLSKNRNGACDRDIAFRIDTEAMGTDEDGDPITYALVDELDAATARPQQKLSPSERAALAILSDMVAVSGNCPVSEDDWRSACIDSRTVSASDDRESRRKATKRAFEGLARKSAVILRNQTAMLPDIFPCPVDFDGDAFDDFEQESQR